MLSMSGSPLPLLPGWPVRFGGLLTERVHQPKRLLQLALSSGTGFINKFLILIMNLHSGMR